MNTKTLKLGQNYITMPFDSTPFVPMDEEKETLYTLNYTIQFESGNATYKKTGIVRFDIDTTNQIIVVYFDKNCSCYRETFPYMGKLISVSIIEEK